MSGGRGGRLTPIHVFIGPGDSGKTSLLEAISAFHGRLKTPATRWFPAVANPRKLIAHGSSVPTIDLAGHWSERQSPGSPPLPGGRLRLLGSRAGQRNAFCNHGPMGPTAGGQRSPVGLDACGHCLPARRRRGEGGRPRRPGSLSRYSAEDAEPAPSIDWTRGDWPNRPRSIRRAAAR